MIKSASERNVLQLRALIFHFFSFTFLCWCVPYIQFFRKSLCFTCKWGSFDAHFVLFTSGAIFMCRLMLLCVNIKCSLTKSVWPLTPSGLRQQSKIFFFTCLLINYFIESVLCLKKFNHVCSIKKREMRKFLDFYEMCLQWWQAGANLPWI